MVELVILVVAVTPIVKMPAPDPPSLPSFLAVALVELPLIRQLDIVIWPKLRMPPPIPPCAANLLPPWPEVLFLTVQVVIVTAPVTTSSPPPSPPSSPSPAVLLSMLTRERLAVLLTVMYIPPPS